MTQTSPQAVPGSHTIELHPGRIDVDLVTAHDPDAYGLLVTSGVVAARWQAGKAVSLELLADGDLLLLQDGGEELAPVDLELVAVDHVRAVVLAPRLEVSLAARPTVVLELLRRCAAQARRAARHRAVVQQPHVAQRVLGVFALLAERFGRVGPDGIVLALTLTHESIGCLVGARRPTVSLALKQLAADGRLVQDRPGRWVLAARALTDWD